jgi:hypothetical protein
MTAQEYALKQQEELEKDNTRRARQLLSLKFSYLQGEDLKKYRMHIRLNGTSLESLERFDKWIRGLR